MGDSFVARLVQQLKPVKGLAALALGGSQARGTAAPESDYDFGLYYNPDTPLDGVQLREAVAPLLSEPQEAVITEPGQWGPWINGGAWLKVDGRKVDLLYRDFARVREMIELCSAGTVSMHYQPGHPHGFCSAIWMGEVALCVPQLDPSGVLAGLQRLTRPYPAALQQSLVRRFHWEVQFSIRNAEHALARCEQTYIAGCVYRALCCVAQVLFALNGRYLINEKGALPETESFPLSIPLIGRRAGQIWAHLGAGGLAQALAKMKQISGDLDQLLARSSAHPER